MHNWSGSWQLHRRNVALIFSTACMGHTSNVKRTEGKNSLRITRVTQYAEKPFAASESIFQLQHLCRSVPPSTHVFSQGLVTNPSELERIHDY